MTSINAFHPAIQTTISFFSNKPSLSELGAELGISKEAVRKRILLGSAYLKKYNDPKVESLELTQARKSIEKQDSLILELRRELILRSSSIYLLQAALERIKKFYPRFKLSRIKSFEKKYLLDMLEKFTKANGLIKDFCKAIEKSPETLLAWKKAYEAHGINGLVDKRTCPNNFGMKLPSWVKVQLLRLFLRFPSWTPHQYHSYIKYDPACNWHVSVPTIKKLKEIHTEKSQEEKERILKRWAFAPGTTSWNMDFTVIIKTENYKLQLLTVSDQRSRFLFSSILLLETSTNQVMHHLEELFLKYGKPDLIKADNGPEFRMDCRENLRECCVYLFNSPFYYGQFSGSHERIHLTLKNFISDFESHKNLTRLVNEISSFTEQYNHDFHFDYLDGKTSFEVYSNEKDFVPKMPNVEIIKPYEKDNELRMKFSDRDGNPARITMPIIPTIEIKTQITDKQN